jgi:hypothetical protein
MSKKLPKLQVSIPSFNRHDQIKYTLESLLKSVDHLPKDSRGDISIAIYNNSIANFAEYQELINYYSEKFNDLGIYAFEYNISGFDIGAANNCAVSHLNAKAIYSWFLPDDDLAATDSLLTILNTINEHNPCFIHGGVMNKTVYPYSQTSVDTDALKIHGPNSIYKVITANKVKEFLPLNTVQAQEHVYRVDALKNFLSYPELIKSRDEMIPALFGIVCLQDRRPFILLKNSLGIFRDGDPKSSWRHLWYKVSLISYPALLEKCVSIGLIKSDAHCNTVNAFEAVLDSIAHRPDIFLGLNRKYQISPIVLFARHPKRFIFLTLMSPFAVLKKLINIFFK